MAIEAKTKATTGYDTQTAYVSGAASVCSACLLSSWPIKLVVATTILSFSASQLPIAEVPFRIFCVMRKGSMNAVGRSVHDCRYSATVSWLAVADAALKHSWWALESLPEGWTAWGVGCLGKPLIRASQFKAFHGI